MNQYYKCCINTFALVLAVFVVFVTYILIFQYNGFINFAESYLAEDGLIDYPAGSIVRLYAAAAFGFIILFFLRNVRISFVRLDSRKMFFCYLFTAFLIVISLFRSKMEYLYREDGVLESMTVVLALISSGLLFFAGKRNDKVVKNTLTFLSLILFLFAMEEISWGQRIFGWEIPEILRQINHQKEINLHNIFNFLVPLLYVLFFSSLSLLIFSREKIARFLNSSSKLSRLEYTLPPEYFYYFGYIFLFLAGFSLFRGGELAEEIFSVFFIFYSTDLFKRSKLLRSE